VIELHRAQAAVEAVVAPSAGWPNRTRSSTSWPRSLLPLPRRRMPKRHPTAGGEDGDIAVDEVAMMAGDRLGADWGPIARAKPA